MLRNPIPNFPPFCEQPVSITIIIVLWDLEARKLQGNAPHPSHLQRIVVPLLLSGPNLSQKEKWLLRSRLPSPTNPVLVEKPWKTSPQLAGGYHLSSFPWFLTVTASPVRCENPELLGHHWTMGCSPGLSLLRQLAPQVGHLRSSDANLHAQPL